MCPSYRAEAPPKSREIQSQDSSCLFMIIHLLNLRLEQPCSTDPAHVLTRISHVHPGSQKNSKTVQTQAALLSAHYGTSFKNPYTPSSTKPPPAELTFHPPLTPHRIIQLSNTVPRLVQTCISEETIKRSLTGSINGWRSH